MVGERERERGSEGERERGREGGREGERERGGEGGEWRIGGMERERERDGVRLREGERGVRCTDSVFDSVRRIPEMRIPAIVMTMVAK